jgi:hypothetical protein
VVEGLRSGPGRIKEDAEPIFEFGLAREISESGRTKRLINGVAGFGLGIELGGGFGGHGLDLGAKEEV